jgi:hypothetical protein
MLKSTKTSNCTVRLLTLAAQAAYRVQKDNLIEPAHSEAYRQGLIDLSKHGYAITDTIAPIKSKGTGTTPLAAVCLCPHDSTGPIVISFRGTKTMRDLLSDIRLVTVGVVDKVLRDAAFEFYQKVRNENPGRELVITGHSLGGHLAQYVATKAYNTDPKLASNPLVQVRTFNTAPLFTTHSEVFKKKRHLLLQFVNYRLSSDLVSDLPLQQYYGSTFVFPSPQRWYYSHNMGAMTKHLPDEIMSQVVGTSNSSKQHTLLIELTSGVMTSYQCRVQGQFFSRFRAGSRNVAAMQKELPDIVQQIKNGDYNHAIDKLGALKSRLDGKVSQQIIVALIKNTLNVQLSKQIPKHKEAAVIPLNVPSEMNVQLNAFKTLEKDNLHTAEIESNEEAEKNHQFAMEGWELLRFR